MEQDVTTRRLTTGTPKHWAEIKGNERCLTDDRRSLSWAELEERSARLAGGLKTAVGVKTGDRVAVLMSNRVEWFETSLALARSGATLVSLHQALAPPELRRLLAHSDSTAMITDDDLKAATATEWIMSVDCRLDSVVALTERHRARRHWLRATHRRQQLACWGDGNGEGQHARAE